MPFSLRNLCSPLALLLFLGTAALGVGVDLWTKHLAFTQLATNLVPMPDGTVHIDARTHKFLPGVLHFTATNNYGAVFGLGQGNRIFFVAVSFLAVPFLIYLFATSGGRRIYQFVLGLLLGGVVGNMYDRIVYGYVRDMIYALPGWKRSMLFGVSPDPNSWRNVEVFPWIFNVADSLLCFGVFLIVVHYVLYGDRAHYDAVITQHDDSTKKTLVTTNNTNEHE